MHGDLCGGVHDRTIDVRVSGESDVVRILISAEVRVIEKCPGRHINSCSAVLPNASAPMTYRTPRIRISLESASSWGIPPSIAAMDLAIFSSCSRFSSHDKGPYRHHLVICIQACTSSTLEVLSYLHRSFEQCMQRVQLFLKGRSAVFVACRSIFARKWIMVVRAYER